MYPENWFALCMLQHAIVYKMVEEAFPFLVTCTISTDPRITHANLIAPNSNRMSFKGFFSRSSYVVAGILTPYSTLWRSIVHLMVMFLMSRALQVCREKLYFYFDSC